MNFNRLRNVLERLIVAQGAGQHTHTTLVHYCAVLELPRPVEDGSKKERMLSSCAALEIGRLPAVAELLLQHYPPDTEDRNILQDLLWEGRFPEISKRIRREIARSIEGIRLFLDGTHFDRLLDNLWVLDTDPFEALMGPSSKSLRSQIERHVHHHPGNWNCEYLFDRLGAYTCSDRRFTLFIEGLASSDVRPDEPDQRAFVAAVNGPLKGAAVELRETGVDGGYPLFELVSLHAGARGAPKNLIFASEDKPDIRFRDAIDNTIEIVTNADKVLAYDRPIGSEGLRWSELQDWWAAEQSIADPVEAKETLYRRLKSCLPTNSPPQRKVFDAFYRGFAKAVPELPALLPEVWLHWDPLTIKQRGRDAMLRFRMDFLLLLPHNVRIVIEVDGKHHYADAGIANAKRYAAMMHGDRDLRLAGYEVFRFGASELLDDQADDLVKTFFIALFKRHGMAV